MSTPLSDLLERVEAAAGPDRYLAVDILTALNICSYIPDEGDPTASLDAAVWLVGRVRPGWSWGVAIEASYPASAQVWNKLDDTVVRWPQAASPALALLAALLRSLLAEEASHD